MVLGDAHLHEVVDGGYSAHKCLGAMPDRHGFPAVLQLPGCLPQISGSSSFSPWSPRMHPLTMPSSPSQYWRLLTTFLYFGPFSLDLLFHVYFLQRYARLLEESSGRSPAKFSWLLLYATVSLLLMSPLVSMPFLGHPLSSTLVYIWSRRNPDTRLSFLGLLVFTAPYLPWVLMGFSLVLHGTVPKDELMGVLIGHFWYFFNDVYPPLHNGSRPLEPPSWWTRLFEGRPAEDDTANEIGHGFVVAGGPEVVPGEVR